MISKSVVAMVVKWHSEFGFVWQTRGCGDGLGSDFNYALEF